MSKQAEGICARRTVAGYRCGAVIAGLAVGLFGAGLAVADGVPPSPREPKWPEGGGQCNEPVLMVVVGSILPGASMKAYGEAVSKSSVYKNHQGYYVAFGPMEMFEGEWPGNRLFLVAEFPCVEAARGMWFSSEYQERIRPLREGCCDLTVSVHKKQPNPLAPASESASPPPYARAPTAATPPASAKP